MAETFTIDKNIDKWHIVVWSSCLQLMADRVNIFVWDISASFNIDTGRPNGRPVLGFGHPVHLFLGTGRPESLFHTVKISNKQQIYTTRFMNSLSTSVVLIFIIHAHISYFSSGCTILWWGDRTLRKWNPPHSWNPIFKWYCSAISLVEDLSAWNHFRQTGLVICCTITSQYWTWTCSLLPYYIGGSKTVLLLERGNKQSDVHCPKQLWNNFLRPTAISSQTFGEEKSENQSARWRTLQKSGLCQEILFHRLLCQKF